MTDITDDFKSKTALKNEAKDIHTFGKILVGLTDKQINKIDLPENVHEAIRELKKLKNTLSKHKGSKPVYFDIHDSKNKFKLNMISEQAKVSITKELLVSLEQDEFRYKLN